MLLAGRKANYRLGRYHPHPMGAVIQKLLTYTLQPLTLNRSSCVAWRQTSWLIWSVLNTNLIRWCRANIDLEGRSCHFIRLVCSCKKSFQGSMILRNKTKIIFYITDAQLLRLWIFKECRSHLNKVNENKWGHSQHFEVTFTEVFFF